MRDRTSGARAGDLLRRRRPAHGVVDDDRRRVVTGHVAGHLAEARQHAGAVLGVGDDDDRRRRRCRFTLVASSSEGLVVGAEPHRRRDLDPRVAARRSSPRRAAGRRRRRGTRRAAVRAPVRSASPAIAIACRESLGAVRTNRAAIREVVEGEGGGRRRAREDAGVEQVRQRGQRDRRRRRPDDGVDVLLDQGVDGVVRRRRGVALVEAADDLDVRPSTPPAALTASRPAEHGVDERLPDGRPRRPIRAAGRRCAARRRRSAPAAASWSSTSTGRRSGRCRRRPCTPR